MLKLFQGQNNLAKIAIIKDLRIFPFFFINYPPNPVKYIKSRLNYFTYIPKVKLKSQ